MKAAVGLALLGMAAAPAPTDLTVNGIGPVRFGMTVQQVERATGNGLVMSDPEDPSCAEGSPAKPGRQDMVYLFEHRRLARITVWEVKGQTLAPIRIGGIGVGGREADIRRRFPSARIRPHVYSGPNAHYVDIRMGNGRSYRFETLNGRVTALHAGLYPSLDYVEGCA